jgi:hypothetical protein
MAVLANDSETPGRSMADLFTEISSSTATTAGVLDSDDDISDRDQLVNEEDTLKDEKMRILIETIKPSLGPVVTGKQIGDFMEVMCMIDAGWEVQAAIKEMRLNMTERELSRYMAAFCAKAMGISDAFLSVFRRRYPRQPLEQQLQQKSVEKKKEGEGENSFEKTKEANKEKSVEKTKESDQEKFVEEKKEIDGEKAKNTENAKLEIQPEAHTRQMVARGERVVLTGYLVVIGISVLALGFGLMQQYSDVEALKCLW